MSIKVGPILLLICSLTLGIDALVTNYAYYTEGGLEEGLNSNQPYFTLNKRNISIYSGAFHYFRVHKSQWRDRLRKLRAVGLNTVETYVAWNLHEPQSGVYDLGDGGSDYQDLLDIKEFLKIAQEEDLFVLLRAGPYICAEFEFGGLPNWLLREKDIQLRTSDEVYLGYVKRWFGKLLPLVSPFQFTKGGPIIALQVENEYGNTGNNDPDYLRSLVQTYRDNGIVEMLYTSDPPGVGSRGALPNELLMTANFGSGAKANLEKLDTLQTNKPTMTMEFWSGWFDHYGENHHTRDNTDFKNVYEEILSYPASVNMYMFVGSTNYIFSNGANSLYGELNNSGLQPTTSSYDYDSPIAENGDLTEKYTIVKDLLEKYNPIKTQLPEVPETKERQALEEVKITQQILLSEIIDGFANKIDSEEIVPMELLDINNSSGQAQGYIVYRKTNLLIPANAVLTIKGFVRDTVMVLINGVLVSPPLTKTQNLNEFGYWRLHDSSLTLTTEGYENATLDLVVLSMSRNNYGSLNQFQQFKGLIDDVLINEEKLTNFQIIPLEFKKSWTNSLQGWHDITSKENTPALYKATFNVTDASADTYLDVSEWRKGFAILNGFVLGRIFMVGPQQALYIPAALLREGLNEMVIVEHFTAPDSIKFSKEPIWGVGVHLEQ